MIFLLQEITFKQSFRNKTHFSKGLKFNFCIFLKHVTRFIANNNRLQTEANASAIETNRLPSLIR